MLQVRNLTRWKSLSRPLLCKYLAGLSLQVGTWQQPKCNQPQTIPNSDSGTPLPLFWTLLYMIICAFVPSLRLGWTTLGGNWMDHANSQSGHMFKNSVGRKEKLRFLKALSPDLCPAGTLGQWACSAVWFAQWGHVFIHMQVMPTPFSLAAAHAYFFARPKC